MAEVIEWANREGYTLVLTRDELEELTSLLKGLEGANFFSFSSPHFEIELSRD